MQHGLTTNPGASSAARTSHPVRLVVTMFGLVLLPGVAALQPRATWMPGAGALDAARVNHRMWCCVTAFGMVLLPAVAALLQRAALFAGAGALNAAHAQQIIARLNVAMFGPLGSRWQQETTLL